jgi:cobalt/nickel transport system permease protein
MGSFRGGARPVEHEQAVAGPVARLDPRARILAAIAFAVVTVAIDSLRVLLIPLAIAGIALLAARLPVRQTLGRMAVLALDRAHVDPA